MLLSQVWVPWSLPELSEPTDFFVPNCLFALPGNLFYSPRNQGNVWHILSTQHIPPEVMDGWVAGWVAGWLAGWTATTKLCLRVCGCHSIWVMPSHRNAALKTWKWLSKKIWKMLMRLLCNFNGPFMYPTSLINERMEYSSIFYLPSVFKFNRNFPPIKFESKWMIFIFSEKSILPWMDRLLTQHINVISCLITGTSWCDTL